LPGWFVATLATAVSIVVWPAARTAGSTAIHLVIGLAMATGVVARARGEGALRLLAVLIVATTGAGLRAEASWEGLRPRALGEYAGWAEVIGDPQPLRSATRVVLEVSGERFEYWARGRAKRIRVDDWESGDQVLLSATRRPLDSERQARVVSQHVVGELEVEWIAQRAGGDALARASGRVRALLERGSRALPEPDSALFRGLVLGDDGDQPPEMVDRFRASGLSHLTAVSGQNVNFVLAAAAPLLYRLRPAQRWAATLALIAWFVAITRFEPSIVRAGTMAGLSATAFVLGRERHPARLLCLAVIGLLLVDPLLCRSVGFWLSVGATAGVTTLGPGLSGRLRALGPLAVPVGVTLAAQAGVAIPAVLVFGHVPLVSVAANVLAEPMAGAVMLYGLPAGLLAGAVPPLAPMLMLPCRLAVRWVDTVALLGARLEPGGRGSLVGWALTVIAVGVTGSLTPGKNRRRDGHPPPDR
jgi:competence protein ComEC